MILPSLRIGLCAVVLLCFLPTSAYCRAILGVDLGSLYMKIALVQSGSPLEIVTNLHSKRKTEQMVLFDAQQRFYGADAAALLARKSHRTPEAMTLMLGRDDRHPIVQVLAERHYPLRPFYNETRAGVELTVDGVNFTPEELTAMVLTHAVDVSVAYSAESGTRIDPPRDCVLTVPSHATQRERRALLDAAALADLNVLTLIDENTAAALHYAMDKTFGEDGEQLLLFYNLGASALQVSLVRFFQHDQPQKFGKPKSVPALEVLSKAWDATCGGLAFDHLLVEYLADQFNAVWRRQGGHEGDVRDYPRAMTKLRLQANRIKHVLSANQEIPVHVDAVHDDVSLQTHVTRAQLEEMAADLLKRAVAPIGTVLRLANKTLDDVTGIELIGGGMRIPKIQEELRATLGDNMELGMHINADESFALGAAFAGANISTAFRVRHVGMTDVNPFPMSITLSDLEPVAEKKANKDDNEEEEVWTKQATIFKSFGKLGVKKTIAFTHDKDVLCALDYEDSDLLPAGTERGLERYRITGVADFAKEMEEKGLGRPKVSLQFDLSSSGITSLIKAEAAVEETYTVEEEVEVDDDEEVAEGEEKKEEEASEKEKEEAEAKKADEEKKEDETSEEKGDDDTKGEEKKEEKPKKTIKVEKEKKRVHKKALQVETYYVGRVQPHTPEQLAESKAKLLKMAENDKERMMLEESRNKVESYIYRIKNMLEDHEEDISNVSNKKQREEVKKLSEKAHEWLEEDGYSADLATMEDKYAELSTPFEKIMLRVRESTARPEAVEKFRKTLTEIEALMVKWETDKPQVTEEERNGVLEKVEEARNWLEDMEKKQSKKKPHEDPAFLSTDVPGKLLEAEKMIVRLSRKPKPKPPKKEEKNETEAAAAGGENATDANATAEETADEAKKEETATQEEATEESTKEETETPKEEEKIGEEL